MEKVVSGHVTTAASAYSILSFGKNRFRHDKRDRRDYQPIPESSLSAIEKEKKFATTTEDADENETLEYMKQHNENDFRPKPGTLAHFFFGFMYDDDEEEDTDDSSLSLLHEYPSNDTSIVPYQRYYYWQNPVILAMSCILFLTSASTAIATTLSHHITFTSVQTVAVTSSSMAATAAILGTACGKWIHGTIPEILGVRRTCILYALLLSVTYVALAIRGTPNCYFWIEFWAAVHWPATIVLLATHVRKNYPTSSSSYYYEAGIFLCSFSSRLGSLCGIIFSSWLLPTLISWRILAGIAAWCSALASSIAYFYVSDSPDHVNEPQNPINAANWNAWFPERHHHHQQRGRYHDLRRQYHWSWTAHRIMRCIAMVMTTHMLPSMRRILSSGTFWIVALAHTGANIVRTCDRILPGYFVATNPSLFTNTDRTALYALWNTVGTVMGLFIAGPIWSQHTSERSRKWMVSRLYLASVLACYALSVFAIPLLHETAPEFFCILQVMAVITAGFGIAIPCYHIPSVVGAVTFGCDKGLFAAYTDGVAYGIASAVWRFVGRAVTSNENSSVGWAYGWAAVALLLVLSAILMVEFMEHYFCRPQIRHSGANARKYETILLA
jgi:MFS family permease